VFALKSGMAEQKFETCSDRLVSERLFWLGVALYAIVFTATIHICNGTASRSVTKPAMRASSTGSLIFGTDAHREINDVGNPDNFMAKNHATRGALTLRRESNFDFRPALNWSDRNQISADPLIINHIANVPHSAVILRMNGRLLSAANDLHIGLGD
jgi:hypothetical protein